MIASLAAALLWLAQANASPVVRNAAVSFNIASGTPASINDPAPVGISFEFFAFPEYLNQLGGRTRTCLANLDGLSGVGTKIRIGGTTQDRATFAPDQNDPVEYYVAAPKDAPANLTYGPSFFDLAASLSGPTVIGLNRRLNKLDNGIAAAKAALNRMTNLDSFELGNEPDLYSSSDPIANGSAWSPKADIASQLHWQSAFSSALGGKTDFIEAGVYLQPPKFSIQNLAPAEGGNLPIVKTFADHSYPQSACGGAKTNLEALMNHPDIVQYVAGFKPEVAAAKAAGKPIVFGETNSATCGGGGISPTFGAGLWIVDYVFQSVILGYERLYFHHGTVGNSPYSWWGANNVFAPYYGAYFAAAALSHSDHISQLDTSSSDLAAYAFSSNGAVGKLAVLNMAYYPESRGTSARPSQTVSFSGITNGAQQVSVKRLTAPYSTSLTEAGAAVTFYGHSFSDSDCSISGTEDVEWVPVKDGTIEVKVAASEAVLIEL